MSNPAAEVAASCFTGTTVIVITNPLDCLKQRWQIAQSSPGFARGGLIDFARAIVRDEGLLRGLWVPGIGSNAIACTISVGTRLGLYPLIRDGLQPSSGPGQRSGKSMFLSGLCGGALGYIMSAPFFCATRVAQAEAGALDAEGRLYVTGARAGHHPTVPGSNGLGMLAHLARTQGVGGLWRGSEVLVARGALMSATQLGTYDQTKVRRRLRRILSARNLGRPDRRPCSNPFHGNPLN